MGNDKYVKLSAIERLAKPMAAFHGGDEPDEEYDSEVEEYSDDKMVECPKCGHSYHKGE
jgi:adenine-specific DNA methylase